MVHYAHFHFHSNVLVGIMYTKDEVVWMGVYLHGESIGQAQRRLKYDSRSTWIDSWKYFMMGIMDPWAA